MMEQNSVTVALSSDFLTAFAALPRAIQSKVTDFINKFKNNPAAPGINYEKINGALDDKICSVRIDDTYRGIVVRQKETGAYIMLWVDHHDEAYAWAERKRCLVNRLTGNIQIFDVVSETVAEQSKQPNLFSMVGADSLIALGVPKEIVPLVRSFRSAEDFYRTKHSLPPDAYEALEYLANGFALDEVMELFSSEAKPDALKDDFAKALQSDQNKTSFVVIEGEEALRRMMAEPLEKWRIFLHPAQRQLVEKDFSGPCRVLGGAGTGKTVTAMHRAKYLVSKLDGKKRVLFTTFTANLAADIRDNLRKICSVEEMRRIEVIHLDAWVSQFLRQHGYTYAIAYDDKLDTAWDDAIARSGENAGFGKDFYSDEWSKVVVPQECFSREKYLKASRIGRGTRLDREKRIQAWSVFEEYIALMKERQIRDVDMAMYECRMILEKNREAHYSSAIVDEGQDFSPNAYRLLRAIVNGEHANDIFIVGDAHQRIYKKRAVLSQCGINVRGRSSRLRINYRTTEETRKYAFAFLKGIRFDNPDDEYEDEDRCQSLTHGDYPCVKHFKAAAQECAFITDEVKRLAESGVKHKDICLVARTHNLLDGYTKAFREAGIRAFEIKASKSDDRNCDGVRVATMHRVKGLEFQYVFVAAANSRIVPLASAINAADEVSKQECLTLEKCLLYVALTRAQKAAFITSYGKQSEFLQSAKSPT
ncbi:MAG: UvrD-helicase domain-containing protein [Holophagales bacterium]|jgi:superfamily I DNA/RNA helicase/mRNA-degrading endonuclease RelE of RelBE toxin-antitoxin system|nr:UvrD-helicase domain-containing protein [Holophagales bacterium]